MHFLRAQKVAALVELGKLGGDRAEVRGVCKLKCFEGVTRDRNRQRKQNKTCRVLGKEGGTRGNEESKTRKYDETEI